MGNSNTWTARYVSLGPFPPIHDRLLANHLPFSEEGQVVFDRVKSCSKMVIYPTSHKQKRNLHSACQCDPRRELTT
jgi:hypothetical protein